jgi:uncharacterized phage protein (TIGR02218 family)
MSYTTRELSEYDGKPRELFWFMRGSDEWTYSSGAEEVTFESKTFTPVAGLTRSSIKYGSERSRSQLTVTMPRDLAVAQLFVGIPNIDPVWLYVYSIHEGETDYSVVWQGRIRGVDFRGTQATATLDTILASTKKQSLRHLYQNQCNNFMFDTNCTLSEADFSHTATVASITNNVITADDSQIAGYYISGQIKRSNGDRRMVVADTKVGSTHTLELLTAFEDLEVGESVTLIGGACRHTFDTCPVGNKENFGGYPKVPRKNPFKSFY